MKLHDDRSMPFIWPLVNKLRRVIGAIIVKLPRYCTICDRIHQSDSTFLIKRFFFHHGQKDLQNNLFWICQKSGVRTINSIDICVVIEEIDLQHRPSFRLKHDFWHTCSLPIDQCSFCGAVGCWVKGIDRGCSCSCCSRRCLFFDSKI